jgi:hypothetical protein
MQAATNPAPDATTRRFNVEAMMKAVSLCAKVFTSFDSITLTVVFGCAGKIFSIA